MDVPISTSTTIATRDQPVQRHEQLALAGFLAGYSGLTRDAYTLDLRQYVAWCTEHQLAVFGARRADIECFARHLESLGRARATIARRLCTVSCFHRYAEQGLIGTSLAAHVRRPRLDYESEAHRPGPQRGRRHARGGGAGRRPGSRADEPAGPQRAAGLRGDRRGYRGSRAGAGPPHPHDSAQGWRSRDHPLAPRTARAINLLVGERCEGPTFVGANGRRIDRHAARRIVRPVTRTAGIAKRVGPHTLRHAFITAALDAGVPRRDVQDAASHADPRTTIHYDRARISLDRHATYIVATFLAGASR